VNQAHHRRKGIDSARSCQQKSQTIDQTIGYVGARYLMNRLVAWYKAGADIPRLLPKLSTYLGHISLSSTQRYLTMTPALLEQAGARFERYVQAGGSHE